MIRELSTPRDEIQGRAYEKWIEKGQSPDTQLQDWLEAEAEIRQAHGGLEQPVADRIAELTQANHVLHQQLRERTLAVEAAPNGMVLVDANGRITLVNAQVEKLFGYAREELLGQPVEVLVPERFRARHPEHRTAFLVNPQVQAMGAGRDLCAVRKDGSELPVEIGLNPIPTEAGTIVMASVIDITERQRTEQEIHRLNAELEQRVADRTAELSQANQVLQQQIREREQAETALRHQEERLQLALEAGQLGTWDWNIGTGEIIWSRSLEAIHGLAPGSFGGTFADFLKDIHVEDRALVTQAIAQAREQGTALDITYRICWPDGSIHWVEGRGRCFADAGGATVRMLGVCRDITERKQAEEALYQLAAIVESSDDAIISITPDRIILSWNQGAARLLGYPAEEVLGRHSSFLVPTDRLEEPAQLHEQCRRGERIEHFETVRRRKDGKLIDISQTVSPIVDAGGVFCGFSITARDTTGRKQAERRLAAEHAVTRVLAESTALADAAPRILQALCTSLGWDVGSLWSVDRSHNVLVCVELWHAASVQIPELEQLCRQICFAPGIGLPGRVWATGAPAWIANVVGDPNFPRAEVALQEGLHGACGFPVQSGMEVLAILEFFSREIRKPDEALLATMRSISSQISQFIERRQAERVLHERAREFALARQIQRGLLPRAAPTLPGFDIAGASYPTQETGGDYFDFIAMPDGRLGLAIGDASGHGIGAALLIAETGAYLHALAQVQADVGAILTLSNRRLVLEVAHDHFVTLLLARLDPRTRSLVYSSAGHPSGYVLDSRGKVKTTLPSIAPPLGIAADTDFGVAPALALEPGDLVLFVTDGVFEARSPGVGQLGHERLLEVIRANRGQPARDLIATLYQAVYNFAQPASLGDDLTAVVIKVLDI